MQRSGAATRRFYAAFYQWTVRSANPTRRCTGGANIIVARRRNSTMHQASDADRSAPQPSRPEGSQLEPRAGHKARLDEPSGTKTTTSSLDDPQWKSSEQHRIQAEATQHLDLPRRSWELLAANSVSEYYWREYQVEVNASEKRQDSCHISVNGHAKGVKKAVRELERFPSLGNNSTEHFLARMRFLGSIRSDVVPAANLVSEQLGPWEMVVRRRRNEDMLQEYCLPEPTWRTFAESGLPKLLLKRFSVHLEQGKLHDDGKRRCVTLDGKIAQTLKVAKYLEKFRLRGAELPQEQVAAKVRRLKKLLSKADAEAEKKQAEKDVESRREDSGSGSTIAEDQVQAKTAIGQLKEKSGDQAQPVTSSASAITSPALEIPGKDQDPAKQQKSAMDKKPRDLRRLGDDMRSALRHLTQPVALITATMARLRHEPVESRCRGVTVSSFCTVTLSPVPIVSFNLRIPSRSWDAISAAGRLRVHILRASPEGAAAAHAFTLPYEQPHEPFERLRALGAHIFLNSRSNRAPPKINWANAIIANMSAVILPDKCIQVGDHMIVLAEVQSIDWPRAYDDGHEAGALAYGRKGYRKLGEEIKPIERALEAAISADNATTETKVSNSNVSTDASHPESKALDTFTTTIPAETMPPNEDPVEVNPSAEEPQAEEGTIVDTPNAAVPTEIASAEETSPDEQGTSVNYGNGEGMVDLFERFAAVDEEAAGKSAGQHSRGGAAAQQTQARPKNISDLGPSSPLLDDDSLRQVLNQSEASYASGSLPSQAAAENPALAEALSAIAGTYKETHDGTALAESPSPPRKSASSNDNDRTDHSSNDQEPSRRTERASISPSKVNRSKAPHAAENPWGLPNTSKPLNRPFSSWARMPTRMYSTSNKTSDPSISDKILQTTVGDYLCPVPAHRKRYPALIRTRRRADYLQRFLDRNTDDLTPEETTELEDEILIARNQVAKELATRNAHDLRAMLDLGRVNSARAQWLESNLEAGQAVLLAEAKVMRTELYQGKLSVQEFEERKKGITSDYEAIDEQLLRLRDFVDEDEFEGHGEFGGQEGSLDDGSVVEDREEDSKGRA